MKDKSLLDNPEVKSIIDLALAEDRVTQDITSRLIIPEELCGQAVVLAKADGIVSGLEVFKAVFKQVEPALQVILHRVNGERVWPGEVVADVRGRVSSILSAERVALNFLCHLSGVATETARYVDKVKGLAAVITDTRKTMPGMRLLEKQAVKAGGGQNHRFNLGDGVLIKDNHIAILKARGMTLKEIIARAKEKAPVGLRVGVEVASLAQAEETTGAGADMILLDNMSVSDMKEVADHLKGRVTLEASGGVNLGNIETVARSGVDRISIGAITHSAKALDFSLEII